MIELTGNEQRAIKLQAIEQPAPAPGITELLAAIEPYCEWLTYIESHELYFFPEWQFTIQVRVQPDKVEQALLLGAICADCDARGWNLSIETHKDHGPRQYSATITNMDIGFTSVYGRLHAALLAFRDALRAAVCPECEGVGAVWFVGEAPQQPCETCNGTGTVRSE